ncbi:MAG TPA: hypothetical protein VFQ82_13075 [Stellaceae bacterium]|nr:hypothetical protein [Stellaceae bacterium]
MAETSIADWLRSIGMSPRTTLAPSTDVPGPALDNSPLFDRLVRRIDARLRRFYGIHEFSDRPECMLRISTGYAERDLRLADGGRVRAGDQIVELHLWNEHLSAHMPKETNGLGRSRALHRHIGASMRELAGYLRHEPSLSAVVAVRASATLVPKERIPQLLRLVRFYGLDAVEPEDGGSGSRSIHDLGDNLLSWALVRTFNPTGQRGKGVLRSRCELWVSRQALIARFAPAAMQGSGRPQPLCGSIGFDRGDNVLAVER